MKTIRFETAKKFKELGLKKESFAMWRCRPKANSDTAHIIPQACINESYQETNADILYPAYTLDEILEMLPAKIGEEDNEFYLNIHVISGNCYKYEIYYDGNIGEDILNENPVEAAAQLLIWCIENGYAKVEEINYD